MAKGREKPNPDVLRCQCEIDMIPITDLTALYGYSDVSNLYYWCRLWGIQPYRHPRPYDHLRKQDLSPTQHQIVMGTLLGDGSIGRHSDRENAGEFLVIAHGQRQRDYLEWKKKKLEPFIVADEPAVAKQFGFSAHTNALRYTYHSITHPAFVEYYRMFYPTGIKRITRPILERLNEVALAFWLMDDGSFHRTRGYIHISTNAFEPDDLEVTAQWFKDEILGIAPYIHSAGREFQYSLAFNRAATDRLRPLVQPHFFSPLLYKLGV